MTAVDDPGMVRGVVIAAASSKVYPAELTVAVTKAGDLALSGEARLAALRLAGNAMILVQFFEFEVPKRICRDMIGTSNSPH
jgi:hypothetical protein